ncbi:hypothetical protein AVEN_210936-1 [Araneus ventricosus]|uniref:Uncharacterized protein n=1 Tax=Araneus ventricosus TaxID=182803 RepID=A0A4Y2DH12_ARAVE|nr:hypothetical protein AVEN_210936-1 [Araneus ventricosus]
MDNIYLCKKSANEGDINVGLFAGGRKECHLANEDPDQYINGRISFVGKSGELDFTYAGERQVWLRIETRQCSHQGLRVLIFTDRPGPRAHLVGVYIELRDLFQFSSAVQRLNFFFIGRASSGLYSAEEFLDSCFWILLSSKRLNFSSSEERRVESTHQTSPEERSVEAA